jgi:hypothetical protein
MKPQLMPSAPGHPCWNRASVETQLSAIAQVSDVRIDWFLATHSPVQCRGTSGDLMSEGEVFRKLYGSASHEQLVVIKGPPGAGKSQLINWLRLRFEDALLRGEERYRKAGRVRTVLIRRRSGSLKDALEQLVAQLPEYERFLEDVKAAIAQISDEQARRKLSFEISVVLSGLHQRGELPGDLQHLYQLFQDLRMSETMCRPGGTIDRNIQRLTSESGVQDRESLPLFPPEEFDFQGKRRGHDVDTLMLDLLEDEEELRVKAAEIVNAVLREALANVTGIKGQTLHEVFRGIRRAMFQSGEELALFVEDVSTMSILDEELVNALEPQGDTDLCGMLSVLGMTIPAYKRLQENKKDRITLALEIQGELGQSGTLADEDHTDQFVARYLNALRAGDAQTSLLAEDRRQHSEIRHSACTDCDMRAKCFEAFDSVSMGDVEVGLYPLSRGAAFRLLEGLEGADSSRNPRGLLRGVVLPLLEAQSSQTSRASSFGINVKPQVPDDLSLVRQTLLGGWDNSHQGRLSYLTWYWTGHRRIRDARESLEPMLPWLGLPPFTGETVPRPAPNLPLAPKAPTKPLDPVPAVSQALEQGRQRLQTWFDQKKKLARDAEFRELLLEVVKSSLDEENTRSPSFAMQQMASGNRPLETSNIFVEDMEARPTVGSKVRFRFNRDQATYDLLTALLEFRHLGAGKSWGFEGGIAQQRVYAKWLRQNREAMLKAYNVTDCSQETAHRVAAAYLVIAYRFCRRMALPSDTAAAVEALASFEPIAPDVLTATAEKIATDARDRVPTIRSFLFRELSVPQGGARTLTFIDSRILQEAISQQRTTSQLPEFDHPAVESDYPEVYRLSRSVWGKLTEALQAEHEAMSTKLESLRKVADRWAIEPDDLGEDRGELTRSMKVFLQSARAVAKACINANQSMGRRDLQDRILDLPPAKVTAWVACLDDAEKAEAGGPDAMLSVDLGPLLKLHAFVLEVDQAMQQLSDQVKAEMAEVVTAAHVEAERARAYEAVQSLMVCIEPMPAEQQKEDGRVNQDQ